MNRVALCILIVAAAGCSQSGISKERGHTSVPRSTPVFAKATPGRRACEECPRVSGKPRLPIEAKLEMVGGVDSAGQAKFRLSVTADIDSPDAEITIKLPNGSQLVEGALSWKGSLKAGRLHQMTVTAVVPDKPNYRVTADIVLLQTDKAKLRKRVTLNVHMGKPAPPEQGVKTGHKHKAVPLEEFLKKSEEK